RDLIRCGMRTSLLRARGGAGEETVAGRGVCSLRLDNRSRQPPRLGSDAFRPCYFGWARKTNPRSGATAELTQSCGAITSCEHWQFRECIIWALAALDPFQTQRETRQPI